MRMKRLMVAVLVFAMFITGIAVSKDQVQAAAISGLKLTEDAEFTFSPGETGHIKLSVAAVDLAISRPSISISAQDSKAPFTFTKPNLNINGTTVDIIYSGSPTSLEFDVYVKDTAKIGTYPVNITFSYYDVIKESNETSTITTTIKVLEEKQPAQLTVSNFVLGNSKIGSNTAIAFTVKNEGEITARNTYLTMALGDSIDENYSAKNIKIGDLAAGETKDVNLPVTILSNATAGRKTLTANFTYKTADGEAITSAYNIYANLTAANIEAKVPKLSIKDVKYQDGLKSGENFNLFVKIKNAGGADASNIKIDIDNTSIDASGIIKNYYTEGITISNMASGNEDTIKIPLTVSKYATGGLKGLKTQITYSDKTGNTYTTSDMVYVDIAAPTPKPSNPDIVIKKVTQSPEQPLAGDKVEVSFDVVNKSSVDVSELKIFTEGLTSATFAPVNAEPYQYIEKLKAGDTVRVTIPLTVSKNIVEGMNSINVRYSYIGNEAGTIVTIPIRNVKNDMGGISKPKIIVSKYSSDVQELRAGDTFNFTFNLYNTNSTVAAKNITVTISQADNIFNVTQGSNSFFINKMQPGETVSETVEMKVKADATTKTYPLDITIEYEYDGAEPNPATGEIGEKRTEKVNLQAIENSRPVADNVNVYSYDGNVVAGNTATLAFDFYNMGKSPLNNVTAYVEGDFTKADGSMYFIGSVEAGSSTYVEFDVIPNIEGTANGVLRITFEDSNGDEKEFTKEFSTEIMSADTITPPPGDGSGEVFNPEAPLVKKNIVPIWAFALIEVFIFVLFIPVTRTVIINIYKKKLRKKEEDQY